MAATTILAVGKITPTHRSIIVATGDTQAAQALNAYLEASISKPELACAPDSTLQAMIDAAHDEARRYFGFDDDAPLGLIFTPSDEDECIEDDYEWITRGC